MKRERERGEEKGKREKREGERTRKKGVEKRTGKRRGKRDDEMKKFSLSLEHLSSFVNSVLEQIQSIRYLSSRSYYFLLSSFISP